MAWEPCDHSVFLLSLFGHLTRVIVGQQVSTKAAESIWQRILKEFGSPLKPSAVMAGGFDALRGCGCSGRKAITF